MKGNSSVEGDSRFKGKSRLWRRLPLRGGAGETGKRLRARRNIHLMLLFRPLLACGAFVVPGLVDYLQAKSLSLTQVGLLQGAFGVSLVLVELVSSAVSDRRGRRHVLMFGCVGLALGHLSYLLAASWVGFLLAEVSLAVGFALISGVDDALIVESLDDLGELHSVNRLVRLLAQGQAAFAVVAFGIGGLLATIDPRVPFLVALLCSLVSLGIVVCFSEPEARRQNLGEEEPKTIAAVLHYWRSQSVGVRRLLISKALFFGIVGSPVWLYPVLLERLGSGSIGIGVSFAAMNVVMGLTARCVREVEVRRGLRRTFGLMSGGFIASCAVLALWRSPLALSGILVHQVLRGVEPILYANYLARRIHRGRATVMSTAGAIRRFVYVFCMVPAMALADVSLQFGLLWLALCASVLFLQQRGLLLQWGRFLIQWGRRC